jgi:transcriptional regulator with XRE-family HTH domain
MAGMDGNALSKALHAGAAARSRSNVDAAEMAKHVLSLTISSDVVKLLVDRGMTLTQIARKLGVSKSYISRVNSGTRSFTLDHLMTLERAVGEPLPWLLIESIPIESVSPELRPLYEATRKLLKPKERRSTKKKAAAA